MSVDFSAFNKQFDTADVEKAEEEYKQFKEENKGGEFKEVPSGVYEVELANLEKKHVKFPSGGETDQVSIDFKITSGDYENQHLFYNGSFDDNWARGLVPTAELISGLTDGQVTTATALAMLSDEDCEDNLLDLFQMLSGQYSYDLNYRVTQSKKLNPRTQKPYTNRFFAIDGVYDN